MSRLVWWRLDWQRPIDPDACLGLLTRLASDGRSPQLVFEARGRAGAVAYWLGAPDQLRFEIERLVTALMPGTMAIRGEAVRAPSAVARQVKVSTRHRAIRTDDLPGSARMLLTALTAAGRDEELVVQLVLGPRRIPLAVPTKSPSSVVSPWWYVAWHGNGQTVDSEKRGALRDKVSVHGFACVVRLGVTAASADRRRRLLDGTLAALRTTEVPGVQLRLVRASATRLSGGRRPFLSWPLRLNVREVLTLTAWPFGDADLPGQPPLHPRRLPAPAGAGQASRVVAASTAPGGPVALGLSAADALHHLQIIGPTGVGKSALMGRLIGQDIAAGHGAVVIEPKGDLVAEVLAHIPEKRRGDVVVLDPADPAPVGLNGLNVRGRSPEVIADGLLSVFKALYADSWGPRTQDILHAALLTLASRPDASLVMLPLLLTNPGFRRSITRHVRDGIALGPFWAWYEALSDAERGAVIAPVMNKLRAWLINPRLRAVLGQRQPRFDLSEVFTHRRILLVPLRTGIIGEAAARLLGSLLVAQLWQTIQARGTIDPARRHPVMVSIDEVQDYLHLPTDLGDALAQARGWGVGFTLAHQHLGQLPRDLRAGVLANARSRVCFQLAYDDAVVLAKGHPELSAEDLIALGRYEVYASLCSGGRVTPYASGRTLPPGPACSDPEALRAASRSRYGRPLDAVEADFAALLDDGVDLGATGRRRRQP